MKGFWIGVQPGVTIIDPVTERNTTIQHRSLRALLPPGSRLTRGVHVLNGDSHDARPRRRPLADAGRSPVRINLTGWTMRQRDGLESAL
jgi:hypothetical protein